MILRAGRFYRSADGIVFECLKTDLCPDSDGHTCVMLFQDDNGWQIAGYTSNGIHYEGGGTIDEENIVEEAEFVPFGAIDEDDCD